jgi:hypothetical protein
MVHELQPWFPMQHQLKTASLFTVFIGCGLFGCASDASDGAEPEPTDSSSEEGARNNRYM